MRRLLVLLAGEKGLSRRITNQRIQTPGLALAGYVKQVHPARVQVLGRANAKVRDALARGARIAEAVTWARDLVNEPAEANAAWTGCAASVSEMPSSSRA